VNNLILTEDIGNRHLSKGLPVMEMFYTIQGEGMHQGRAAYFIRLAGCDVGCHWCDVKESWSIENHPVLGVKEIVEKALTFPSRLAVITGGEPLLHDLSELTQELKSNAFEINIETSGSNRFSGHFDWICLSPKKFKMPLTEIYEIANELKVVVFNKSDFGWAKEQAAKVSNKCHLLLQPEWSRSDRMMPLIIEFVQANPEWRICLQTHKFMQIP
jgi:organic radical activating enzyme